MKGPQQGERVDPIVDPPSGTILDLAGKPPPGVQGPIAPTEPVTSQQRTQAVGEKNYHLAFNKFLQFIHPKLFNYVMVEGDKGGKIRSKIPEDKPEFKGR